MKTNVRVASEEVIGYRCADRPSRTFGADSGNRDRARERIPSQAGEAPRVVLLDFL